MPRKFIERDFPHVVATVVPERGLRGKWNAMNDFHARHGIRPHVRRARHKDGCRYIRWYFADREIAEVFAAKFVKAAVSLRSLESLDQSQNPKAPAATRAIDGTF